MSSTRPTAGADAGWTAEDPHPFVLAQRALDAVKRDREAAERQLAEEWCATQQERLFIDGSIATSDRVAAAPNAIGVIKSHRTLYVAGAAMRVVQSLPVNHRSSVIRVEAYHRTSVASWYLRIRDCVGQDPMWGLLRVETALPDIGESPQGDRRSREPDLALDSGRAHAAVAARFSLGQDGVRYPGLRRVPEEPARVTADQGVRALEPYGFKGSDPLIPGFR